MRRIVPAICAAILLAFAAIVAVGWALAWRELEPVSDIDVADSALHIMNSRQYGDLIDEHARPYTYSISAPGGGAVLVFGIEHTRDPQDSQLAALLKELDGFGPDIVLIEGRLGFMPPLVADPVQLFGESGAVYRHAQREGIRVETWEPPLEREIAAVLEDYSAEQAALFYILRPYFSNRRHGRPANPNAFVEEFRRERTGWPGLEGAIASMAEIDSIWQRDFAGLPDWRDTSDEYGLPGYLAGIADASNMARDRQLVSLALHYCSEGRRVFAVCGSSHAVKVEPALRDRDID